MDEFSFIQSIRPKYYKQSSVIKGIGDDGAIVKPPFDSDLVMATDTMVNNIHFSLDYMTFEDVGYRVLAANLSDLAAMGSSPLYYLVNITSPKYMTNSNLKRIIDGMKELAGQYKMDLIGGDTTSGNELVITVTVLGSLPNSKYRLRSSARLNDIVFVTGNLGESGYGLKLLQSNVEHHYFNQKHIRPSPRIDFVDATTNVKRMCLNDISDGLSSELYEIAEASKVSIAIDWAEVPFHDEMASLDHTELRKLTLSSGEDFELVGTCSDEDWNKIREVCDQHQIKVTQIGQVIDDMTTQPTVYINEYGKRKRLNREGYKHGKN
ncbi:thiamine-phosphate kinase [Filobacillus milosensis]|nr:thiamine-phosphate kinase [Filobacillus milosensis]